MRIAYLTNQYPAPSHTFIRREIAALEDRGHELRRFSIRRFTGELKDPDDRIEAGKTQHILGLGIAKLAVGVARAFFTHPAGAGRALVAALRYARLSKRGFLPHLAYLVEAAALADECGREQIEHLHVHFGTNPATVAALAHEISGLPFSFTVHGPEEFDRPDELALGLKIRVASFVVAVSSFGRSQLMRWADASDWKKLYVVHCGIDDDYRKPATAAPPTEQRLVCVARLSEQKGHMLLVQAAARLRDEGLHFQLTLVGDGPLRAEIEREIQRLSLGDIVTLTGWIAQHEVRSEILRAKAMVLPSFAEGLPVVLMESMALMRPVISTYIAGIPELVRPENGWLVPAGDTNALVEAMSEALSADSNQMRTMGQAARLRVLERHDISRSALRLEGCMLGGTNRQTEIEKRPHVTAQTVTSCADLPN